MYSLEIIKSINNRAAAKALKSLKARKQSRDCSFCITPKGIVLHSARHRDTVYVHGGSSTYRHLANLLSRLDESGNQSSINQIIERRYSKFAA